MTERPKRIQRKRTKLYEDLLFCGTLGKTRPVVEVLQNDEEHHLLIRLIGLENKETFGQAATRLLTKLLGQMQRKANAGAMSEAASMRFIVEIPSTPTNQQVCEDLGDDMICVMDEIATTIAGLGFHPVKVKEG
jgi:hypothetical protein